MPYKVITKIGFSEAIKLLKEAENGEIRVTIDDGYVGEGDLMLIESMSPFSVTTDGDVIFK